MSRSCVALSALLQGVVMLGLLTSPLGADTWMLPEKRTWSSPNHRFSVTILPRPIASLQYWEGKGEGRANPGPPAASLPARTTAVLTEKRWYGHRTLASFSPPQRGGARARPRFR